MILRINRSAHFKCTLTDSKTIYRGDTLSQFIHNSCCECYLIPDCFYSYTKYIFKVIYVNDSINLRISKAD